MPTALMIIDEVVNKITSLIFTNSSCNYNLESRERNFII